MDKTSEIKIQLNLYKKIYMENVLQNKVCNTGSFFSVLHVSKECISDIKLIDLWEM